MYVAYKLDTNFVDIVFQKQRLRISINMKFSEINDPNGICKDITCLLYTSPSPRDGSLSRMPSSA